MALVNLPTEQKLMDIDNRLVVAKGKGVGVGLVDANYCIWSR